MGEKAKKSVVRKLVGRETGSLFQKEIGINYLPNMVVNVKANMPRLGEQAEVTGGDMGLFAQKEVVEEEEEVKEMKVDEVEEVEQYVEEEEGRAILFAQWCIYFIAIYCPYSIGDTF